MAALWWRRARAERGGGVLWWRGTGGRGWFALRACGGRGGETGHAALMAAGFSCGLHVLGGGSGAEVSAGTGVGAGVAVGVGVGAGVGVKVRAGVCFVVAGSH